MKVRRKYPVVAGVYLPLAGGTMAGAIAMGANKITGLGTPTAVGDAVTKAYADLKALISSGSYTGDDSANRAIPHGLGVAPGLVYIIPSDATRQFHLITGLAKTNYEYSTGMGQLAVTAPDATNFYVGHAGSYDLSANSTDYAYYWVAIG